MDYTRILFSEISFKPKVQHSKFSNSINSTTTATRNGEHSNHFDAIKQDNYDDIKHKNGLYNNDNQTHLSNCNNNSNSNHDTNNTSSAVFQLPKHQLCDPSLVKLDWVQPEKIGGGLINVGNTCFLNSVLQCLTYCPPLYNFLVKFNGGHSSSCKINQFCMLCEMEKHIKRIKSSNGSPIKPVSIVQRLKYINKSFQFGRQEDAHEFLRYLIDHMWKACLLNLDINVNNNRGTKIDPRIKETTFINQIFGGYHRSQVLCLQCNSRSNTFDFFMDFILDIRNVKSLEDALKRFTQPETLENENAYKCLKCKRKVAAKKKFTVYRAPNVATFQLKRFDSDRIFGGKVTKFISYPEELDLRPYMSDPTKSSIRYQLSAVLVHVGHSSNSGHYFCFIKNSNHLWYKMDDSSVTLVNKAVVLQQQAYVLFYTRKVSSDHKTPSDSITLEEIKPTSTANNLAPRNDLSNTTSNNATYTSSNNNQQDKPHCGISGDGRANHDSSYNQQNNGLNGLTLDNKSRSISGANHVPTETPAKSLNSQLTTWSGGKSELENDSTKRKLNETTERDLFNEELDQGKVKKVKSQVRDERFSELSKNNPFQRFSNGGNQPRFRNDNVKQNGNNFMKQNGRRHASTSNGGGFSHRNMRHNYSSTSNFRRHDNHKIRFNHNGKHKSHPLNRR